MSKFFLTSAVIIYALSLIEFVLVRAITGALALLVFTFFILESAGL